jgi:hypothetical protein
MKLMQRILNFVADPLGNEPGGRRDERIQTWFFGAIGCWVVASTLVISSPSWGTPLFGEPRAYPVGTSPVGIAVGEFSGTPGLDLATVEEGNTVTILTNSGKGVFARGGQVTVASRYAPTGIASGRFNTDLIDDFALSADDYGNTDFNGAVLLYRSTTTRYRYTATAVTVGLTPACIAFADITGDDIPDLMSCTSVAEGGGQLSLIPGKADGTFAAARSISLGSIVPYRLIAADIDHDAQGRPDLLVVDMTGGAVWILYGKDPSPLPGPAFEAPWKLGPVDLPTAAIVAPFGQDALPDIAVANAQGSQVLIFRQQSRRTFAAPVGYPVGLYPVDLGVGYFDHNTALDVVSVNNHSNDVTLLVGSADGTFQAGETVHVGRGPVAIAVADFNGDNKPDFATANQEDETFGLNSQSVSVALNGVTLIDANCDGSFDAADVETVIHRIFDGTSGCLTRPVTAADISLTILSIEAGQ